jgi:hypothetical protein
VVQSRGPCRSACRTTPTLFDYPAHACRWPISDGWCPELATHAAYSEAHAAITRADNQVELGPWIVSRWLAAIAQQRGGPQREFKRAA